MYYTTDKDGNKWLTVTTSTTDMKISNGKCGQILTNTDGELWVYDGSNWEMTSGIYKSKVKPYRRIIKGILGKK